MNQFYNPNKKNRNFDKLSRIPIKIQPIQNSHRKRIPKWLYTKLPNLSKSLKISYIKNILRQNNLYSVCEEASCPNLSDCFEKGIATFMIMGDRCTRRCTFCDVAHGKPFPLDPEEPKNLSKAVQIMNLKHVVITSVDRDDLRDGGAYHFSECIKSIRKLNKTIKIEILTPDFRGKNRINIALNILHKNPPDIFNHNLETVFSLYPKIRPGSDYFWSLNLLKEYKKQNPTILTKSGIMLGIGETDQEIEKVLLDLWKHNVDIITLGQYLQPSNFHTKVDRYISPNKFKYFKYIAKKIGFKYISSGPKVRSSYYAEEQIK